MWNDGWGDWWIVMPLVMVAFCAAVIWLVASLFRSRPGPTPLTGQRPATPEELLAARYARGEIGDEEYRHRLDTLRGAVTREPRDRQP